MDNAIFDIKDKQVFPIIIINEGKEYLTLQYEDSDGVDTVLHKERIFYFDNMESLKDFCEKYGLILDEGVYTHDLDKPIENPVDYRYILDNWNLLNTVASTVGKRFEGDKRKYNPLYDLFFGMVTSSEDVPPKIELLPPHYKLLLKAFKNKNKLFKFFVPYKEQSNG